MKHKPFKLFALFIPFILFVYTEVKAQNETPEEAFKNVSRSVIYSKVLNEDRNLFIALPAGYDQEENFPVLYMLDGEMVFPYGEALQSIKETKIGPHIIVGIQTNINRNRDMIPVTIESRPGSGGAEEFLEFLVAELKPYIDSTYKTSGFDILYGASNAGLFSLYAMLDRPEVFGAYISSSTMIGHCPEFMYQKLSRLESKDQFNGKILYVHWGMKDYFSHVTEFLPEYYEVLSKELKNHLIFGIKAIKNGGHVPPGGIYEGLSFIYSGNF